VTYVFINFVGLKPAIFISNQFDMFLVPT